MFGVTKAHSLSSGTPTTPEAADYAPASDFNEEEKTLNKDLSSSCDYLKNLVRVKVPQFN